jgi:crotonobetainyl-CoA:carnitine CoA-transferase CaiB-like acyl-CoA transferase
MSPQALDDLRILDLTGGIAGPLGVLLLAEHGAEVIKVEPPGGDPDRSLPSSPVYHRSRQSVVLDLKDPGGRQLFLELCDTADVLVEAFSPGTMAGLGLSYDDIAARCPRLVYCSLPAYPTGTRLAERPGIEALVHARTGQQWETLAPRTGPVFLHSPVASLGASFLVPIGIMSAIHARERTGRGQHVEVSLLQGVMSLTTQIWNWTDRGQFLLEKSHQPRVHQASIYECANGEWIHAATMAGIAQTRSEGSILGIEDVSPMDLARMSAGDRARFEAAKREAFLRQDRDALIEAYHDAGLGAEAIVAPHEHFSHPQLVATGAVAHVDDPEIGDTTQLGVPIFLEGTPGAVKGARPVAGEHTDDVLRALGHGDDELSVLRSKGVI